MRLFQSWSVSAAYLQNLGFVCAKVDTVPHIPLKATENNWLVIGYCHLTCCKLIDVISIALFQLEGRFLLIFTLGCFSLHKSMLQSIKINFCVRKDAKFFTASGVESS
jgi:hypothetical protein